VLRPKKKAPTSLRTRVAIGQGPIGLCTVCRSALPAACAPDGHESHEACVAAYVAYDETDRDCVEEHLDFADSTGDTSTLFK
jgi:hypothetical protein